jgi:hypothetical protein
MQYHNHLSLAARPIGALTLDEGREGIEMARVTFDCFESATGTAYPDKDVPCPDCKNFKPALDAYIQQAYVGYCLKLDWPYWRIIPKGWTPGK